MVVWISPSLVLVPQLSRTHTNFEWVSRVRTTERKQDVMLREINNITDLHEVVR